MRKTLLLLPLWLLLLLPSGRAQSGFYLSDNRKQVDIPFEYTNNFIIINLMFNGVLPLRFIFDTGAEHTILSKREITDFLKVQYEREFRVVGSDMKTPLVAYLVRHIRLDIPEKASAPNEDILVLEEDYFRFEEYAGINVHGILSANVFSRYIVRINYQRRLITLYEREGFKMRDEGFWPIGMEVFRNKLYLNTQLTVVPDSVAPVKLLLDTGAGMPLLLFSNTHPLVHPPLNAVSSNIGMGLGGYLEGFTGRVHQLELGGFSQNGVVTYFQRLDTALDASYLNHRNGLIGNIILSRFEVVLDYQQSTLWLKPGKKYQEAFVYDRSGLSLIASGLNLNRFSVQNVVPHSPAAEAGILRDDQILKVGWTPSSFFSLSELLKKFQKKPGTKLKITIRREGKRMKKVLVLRDLI